MTLSGVNRARGKMFLPSWEKVLGLGWGLLWPSRSLSEGTFLRMGGRRATLGELGPDGESGSSTEVQRNKTNCSTNCVPKHISQINLYIQVTQIEKNYHRMFLVKSSFCISAKRSNWHLRTINLKKARTIIKSWHMYRSQSILMLENEARSEPQVPSAADIKLLNVWKHVLYVT